MVEGFSGKARLTVTAPEGPSGFLHRDGNYLFTFSPLATEACAPSLAMPLRARPYEETQRLGLLEFGLSCGLSRSQLNARVIQLAKIVLKTLEDLSHLTSKVPGLREIIEKEARLFLATFER